MLQIFQATLDPMLVMFACMVVGYILKKTKILPDNADTVLSKLEVYILIPAVSINTFVHYCDLDSLKAQAPLLGIAAATVLAAVGIAYALAGLFERKDAYTKNFYRYALVFGNYGFMGNAIVPLIMGEERLYPYMLFTLPLSLVVYTWGMAVLIPQGEKRQNPLRNLLNPSLVAIFLGIVLGLTGGKTYLPDFVLTSVGSLSAAMGPIAMILTGFVIGKYPLGKLLTKPAVYAVTGMRLLVLPALFLGILLLLGAEKDALYMVLFAFATPMGLNTVVFPAAYGGDSTTGASMTTISSVLCVITLPLMYTLLTALA